MKITSEIRETSLIIKVNEIELDLFNASRFREALLKTAVTDLNSIILDLENVEYMDSSNLGILIEFLQYVKKNNKSLKLLNCQEKILNIMKSTRLIKLFQISDSLESAMK